MRIRKWMYVVVGIVLVVLVAAGVGYGLLYGATQPKTTGNLDLSGLIAPVQIIHEPDGLTHIKAHNLHDLFFAEGVAHAQQRLFQMDLQRRLGEGRLAAVVGKGGLTIDRFFRTLGVYQAAQEAVKHLPAQTLADLQTYVNGINAYLNTNPPLPLAFRLLGYRPQPWTPADVVVWIKMMSWDLSSNYDTELLRYRLLARGLSKQRIAQLMPPYPAGAVTVLRTDDLSPKAGSLPNTQHSPLPTPTAADARQAAALMALPMAPPLYPQASNNWVVSGSLTTTGLPLLANDPHLTLRAPSLWYLVDLQAPGFHATGASFPGVPGVVIGHNDHIAWGVTNVGADVEDLYVLDTADNGTSYRYKGSERPFTVREETIAVKGKPAVRLKVRDSVYGPVISDVVKVPGAQPLAFRWTSLNPVDDTLTAFLGINQARNWTQFKRALSYFLAPSQNFVYADTAGNIGYFAPGKIPIRKPGDNGTYPMPGNGDWGWQGYIPFNQLPQAENPPEGFLVSANNKVTPRGYPYLITKDWAEPYRAERITQMIEQLKKQGKLSPQDMQRIQLDQFTLLYPAFKPYLERISPQTKAGRKWKAQLLTWNGIADRNTRAATVFEAWQLELYRFGAKATGQTYWRKPRFVLQALANGDPSCGGTSASCLSAAGKALDQAIKRLSSQFGGVRAWGKVHQLHIDNSVLSQSPLAGFYDHRLPRGGTPYTINVGHLNPKTFVMTKGPSYREILNLSDLNQSLFAYPGGQSESPLSSWYANLLSKWQDGQYVLFQNQGYPVATRLTLRPK